MAVFGCLCSPATLRSRKHVQHVQEQPRPRQFIKQICGASVRSICDAQRLKYNVCKKASNLKTARQNGALKADTYGPCLQPAPPNTGPSLQTSLRNFAMNLAHGICYFVPSWVARLLSTYFNSRVFSLSCAATSVQATHRRMAKKIAGYATSVAV